MLRTRMLGVLAGLAAGWLCAPAAAEAPWIGVNARANIFAAGRATASSGIPPPGYSFPAGPGKLLTFSRVDGSVQFSPKAAPNGPEGGLWPTDLNSLNGISGIIHKGKGMFLVGVFLDDREPLVAPLRLDFTNDNFTSIAPVLGQTFFIGDGLTGTGSGTPQHFVIPATATRLFLGFAEGYNFTGTPGGYDDNEGSLVATFAIALGCGYSINPTARSVVPEGGSFTVSVATAADCAWTASSNHTWLEITSGHSGSGNGTVTYRVAANTAAAARTGTLTVAGHTHTVVQVGAQACSFNLDRTSATVPAAGGTVTVTVSAALGCAWTAVAQEPWITITPGASGSAGGSVIFTVAPNTGAARTGTLTIAGHTFTVTQAPPVPMISPGGVVNSADYSAKLAPGAIISIFGVHLAPATQAASVVPLPTGLEGVSVEIVEGGQTTLTPLFFVSPGQINAQLPFGITGSSAQVRVRTALGTSSADMVSVLPRAPRLFTKTWDGKGEAIALHADWTPVSAAAPAAPGEALILFLTGLGAVSPAIPAGQPGGDGSEARPLNLVPETVTVTVGGQAGEVFFAGLAPGFAGLYQLNFLAPQEIGAGQQPIVVRCGGGESQAGVTIAVSGATPPAPLP